MFIRLSHKIKRFMDKNWKINLWLAGIAFLVLLTVLAYYVPNVAKIIALIVLSFGGLFALMGCLFKIYDYPNISWVCMLLAKIGVILAVAIVVEIGVFNGWFNGWVWLK